MTESGGAQPQQSRPPWPAAGCVLGRGRYRLLSEVGRDDRRAVLLWRGRDLALDRDVALTLFIAAPHDPETTALNRRVVTHALRSARLETAGAVRMLDVLEAERPSGPHSPDAPDGPSAAVIVAEWTPGCALVDLLDGGPLRPTVAARVLAPLAAAVDAAHSAGLVLGCDHPDRIRVSTERRAQLAFPGPVPTTGPHDDILGLGAMLYLLLTGCWPLPDGPPDLPPAPLGRGGVPISPTTLRPEVPVELSTLALRSIAAPGSAGGVRTAAAVRQVLELNASTEDGDLFAPERPGGRVRPVDPRQAQRRRRIKFGVSMTVLGTATLLILGYAGAQVVSVFTDNGGTPLIVTANPAKKAPAPVPPAILSAPIRANHVAVYDPSGLGSPDHQKDVAKLLSANPGTGWSTDSYFQQFPLYKKGLGVMLSFTTPIAPASVTVVSPSLGTVVEIRTAMSANPRLADTTVVGTATLTAGATLIPLRPGPPTRYLLVWITQLSGGKDHHQSRISQLAVLQRTT